MKGNQSRSGSCTASSSNVAKSSDGGTALAQALREVVQHGRTLFRAQYLYVRRRVTVIGKFIHITVRSLYFPDEFSFYLDTVVRFLFSVYYIPFLAMVFALTHAAIERIVWVLVIPVTQEMERRPFSTSCVPTLVYGLGSIASHMTPFATLAVTVATAGHKVMNCVAEAMVDAYTTQRDMDYPLLRARLRFTVKKKSRVVICGVVSASIAVAWVLLCHTNAFVEWSGREPWATAAAWTVFVIQICFVLTTMLREVPLENKALKGRRIFGLRDRRCHEEPTQLRNDMEVLPAADSPPLLQPVESTSLSQSSSMSVSSPLLVRRSAGSGSRWTASGGSGDSPPHHSPSDANSLATAQASTPAMAENVPNLLGPSASQVFVTYVEDDWWRHHIHTMRYIGFFMVVFFTIGFAVARGPVFGLTSGVMILTSLNAPHLFGHMALSTSAAVTRTLRSYTWLLRHPDALLPILMIATPYQLLLINAFRCFRQHPLLCLMLVWVNMLLAARAIDLAREFDVTVNGSVLWKYADSGVSLPPALASVLEDVHEKQYHRPDVVSLDMLIDIRHMTILYAGGAKVHLKRQAVTPPGTLRRYVCEYHFYAYTLPRLLSLQSAGNFSGSKFRTTRVVLRFISMTLLLLYALLVSGLILQAAFPQLRPLPVRVTAAADNSHLTFDHIVVRMHLLSQNASRRAAKANTSNSVLEGYLSGLPEAASSAFMWHNITSADNEDFYPQLCTRQYGETSVWELALLAVAPYLFNVEEFNTMLRFLNAHMGSDWVIQPRHGASCVPGDSNHQPTGWTDFYEVYSEQRDTSVIAVRGTDMFSFTDFLFNTNIFFEVVLYQLMTTLLPGTVVVPKDLIVDLLRTASLPADSYGDVYETWAELTRSGNHSLRRCQQNNFRRDFFADLYNHIAYVGSRPTHPRHLVLTGHSLGGAVAAIVAAQMRVKAVAFSAPGIALARKKFSLPLRSINENIMSVVSSNDIVPSVGEHGGEVHHVECLAATRELCHAMEFMIGSLWRSCSSVRARFPSIKDVV
ncbi:putative Lipase (class 3) [Leishmania shawi]|uniref:Lipase (Class 3) n=1 Tax=Leishmania shawi TaxID=5680 RepID=A0AAW3CBQ2_9TRYP